MARTVQVGDHALINDYPFIIREILPDMIYISETLLDANYSVLVPNGTTWKVDKYNIPHNVTFAFPPTTVPKIVVPPPTTVPKIVVPPPVTVPKIVVPPPVTVPKIVVPPPVTVPKIVVPPPVTPKMVVPPPATSKMVVPSQYSIGVPPVLTKEVKPTTVSPYEKYVQMGLPSDEIQTGRNIVYNGIMAYLHGDPNRAGEMTNEHLREMFRLYDTTWFDDRITSYFMDPKNTLSIEFGRGTKTAGFCKLRTTDKTCEHIITISRPLFNNPFSNAVETVNGLQCRDQLSCMQLVFEHELCHLILHLWNKGVQSHGPEFKQLALNIFGHTHYRHAIGLGLEEDPLVYRRKVISYLQIGKIVQTRDNGSIVNVQVVKINNKVNTVRFSGINLTDGKRYKIPLVNVILPDTDTEEDDDMGVVDVPSPTFVPPVSSSDSLKYELTPGMIVSVRDKGRILKFRVVSVNRKSNAKNFVGVNLENGQEYRVPLSLVISV
jgi:hypothetical protein